MAGPEDGADRSFEAPPGHEDSGGSVVEDVRNPDREVSSPPFDFHSSGLARSWTVQPPDQGRSSDDAAPSSIQVLLTGQFYVNSPNPCALQKVNENFEKHVKAGHLFSFVIDFLCPFHISAAGGLSEERLHSELGGLWNQRCLEHCTCARQLG